MKRAMQALLIAGERQKEEVLSGKKKITIRKDHRDYSTGSVLIGCHILNWATLKTITGIRFTTVGELTPEELQDNGLLDDLDALEVLREYYPDLTLESKVTVIRWK